MAANSRFVLAMRDTQISPHYEVSLAGQAMVALASGGLWIPDAKTLVVADLHLGKAERIARREGRLTPPYEARETVARLSEVVDQTEPEQVICLGDSFDDNAAAMALPDEISMELARLMAGRTWIWVLGNHDPAPTGLGGMHVASYQIGSVIYRHIAEGVAEGAGEVSGHYHPKVWLRGRGRPAFLADGKRIILPAFGAYTGGLDATDAVFDDLFEPTALALLTGQRIIPAPRKKLPVRRR